MRESTMNIDFKKSANRANRLIDVSTSQEDYLIIKLIPSPASCCCFHCLPMTWKAINEHIFPFGPLEDEGDVLIEKDGEKYVLECHESGPEILLYTIVGTAIGALIKDAIINLITVFLKKSQNNKTRIVKWRILRSLQIEGKIREEEIIEVDLPLTEDNLRILNIKLRNVLEKKKF